MPHTATNLLVHFIFSTKQRCALIKPDFEEDLHAYLGGIVRQIGGTALCVNGTKDHVHLLVRVPANHSIADVARLIKTNSSKWIREKWPQHRLFAWQTGYGAFTVSESGLGAVRDYISNQRENHKIRLSQEEFLAFLKKNKIPAPSAYAVGYILSPLRGAAAPRNSEPFRSNLPFDQPPLTCYKDWFCTEPSAAGSASNRGPRRCKTSDAAKLNTPVQAV